MALVLNEEQQMLKTSAKEFLAENAPVEALRKLRDSKDPKGYDPALWSQMAELGFAGIAGIGKVFGDYKDFNDADWLCLAAGKNLNKIGKGKNKNAQIQANSNMANLLLIHHLV